MQFLFLRVLLGLKRLNPRRNSATLAMRRDSLRVAGRLSMLFWIGVSIHQYSDTTMVKMRGDKMGRLPLCRDGRLQVEAAKTLSATA